MFGTERSLNLPGPQSAFTALYRLFGVFLDGFWMRFRWTYLTAVGVIIAVFGMLAILPSCPLFALFPPFVVGEPCDLSGITGMAGLTMAFTGAGLVLFAEIARRLNPTPKSAIS